MNANSLERGVKIYAFFMCSSFMMLFGVNVSMFAFLPVLLFVVRHWGKLMLRPNTLVKLWLYLFAFGAILSTANSFATGEAGTRTSALAVVPNYLYWCVIVFVFYALGMRCQLSYSKLFGAITAGVFAVVLYVYVVQPYTGGNSFVKFFGKNNLSFLLICLSPYCTLKLKEKSRFLTVAVLAIILLLQLVDGRRAGFVLVLAGSFLAYNAAWLRLNGLSDIFRGAFLAGLLVLVMQVPVIETLVTKASPRVAALIYSGEESYDGDRSYLTRLAMIEKGLALFRQNPLFGIGLNNFTKVEQRIEGDFEGSRYVVNKDIYENTSSHNSYINILAEGGLFLFVPLVLLLGSLLWSGIRLFRHFSEYERTVLISVTMMCVHMSVTNGIVNSLAWFNIALLMYVTTRKKRELILMRRDSVVANNRTLLES
ncbi:MAG TPA: hypothetical protein DIW43_12495 [Spongiibacteraceae bacterium]|nr:hypothetical protein [Spongiibacteraceae bacterium]HCS28269.1 hypothetical protein [Spongiibacteraceae bacterium]